MVDLSGLWPHQREVFDFAKDLDSFANFSSAGCVDWHTEFLTPTGWKKIPFYTPGDKVAQFHPSTLEIDFEEPIDYVSKLCSVMYHFNPDRGLDMMLSPGHRVLHYPNNANIDLHNWRISTAAEFVNIAQSVKIPSAFKLKTSSSIDLTNVQLKLMVAVIADGYFANQSNTCVINIKKERKKVRLRSLLYEAGITYMEKDCSTYAPGYSVFRFLAPRRDKIFTDYYWGCSAEQLAVVAEECLYWDGDCEKKFFTTIKESADFIQFAMSSCGYPSVISTFERNNIGSDRIRPTEYVINRREKPSYFVGGMRKESISKVHPYKNMQYCFTTKTSFWLARRNGRIFATGNTGKCLEHIRLGQHHLENGGSRIIVACPKTLVRSAWLEDLTKYAPDLSVALAEAPEANRKKAFESASDIVLMNLDGMKWLAAQSDRWLKNRLGSKAMLICDESHAFKNHNAQRTKAAFKVSEYCAVKHALSGTPAPNCIPELWAQAKILDGGKRLGKRYTAFRSLMQTPVQNGPFTKWIDKPDAAQITYGLLSDILIRHSFEDVMKHVPDMEHRVIYYDLDKKHRKLYETMEKNAELEHEGKTISTVNASALATKLLQIASGAVYNDPEKEERGWSVMDRGRYELVGELVEARPYCLVFFSWSHQKQEIAKELESRGLSYAIIDGSVKSTIKRNEIVQDFQAGKYRCLLLHFLTGQVGLTLTRATTTIFPSPTYDCSWYEQATKRIRRGVQDKVTESIIIIGRGTRDEVAYEVFTGKKQRMDALNNLFEKKK